MSSQLTVALVALLGVAALALLLRRGSAVDETPRLPEPGPDDEADATAAGEDEADGPGEVLVVESDGFIWVPDRRGIQRIHLDRLKDAARVFYTQPGGSLSREELEWLQGQLGNAARQAAVADALHPGDFTATRVVRGSPDADPWRLEALGRDGEYSAYAFETREAAEAALALLERHEILRRPLDEDDRPVPSTPEDFEEARLRWERTIEELAMTNDPEPEEPR